MIDTWKKALLLERINELSAIYRTDFEYCSTWRVCEELDWAAALLRSCRLDEAELQCERAERALLAERRRQRERRAMYDLIEAWQLRIPRDLHPWGQDAVYSYLAEMRDAVDNPAEVARLASMVRDRVVQELRREAANAETAGFFKDAYRLRRQADRFEAAERFPFARPLAAQPGCLHRALSGRP